MSSSSNGAMRSLRSVAKIGICHACQQYAEDCACCTLCLGRDGDHELGCIEAEVVACVPDDEAETTETKRSMVAPRLPMAMMPVRATMRGLGQDLTLRTPRLVIRVSNDVGELDSTGAVKVIR